MAPALRGRELQRVLNLLIAENNIHFDHKVGKHKWPREHKDIFATTAALGKIDCEQYHTSSTIESQERPWREQNKRRAARIAGLASRCLYSRQNEAGWRLELESLILERFSTEVTCRKCSARLWRSEVEVTFDTLDTFAKPLKLEDRQRNRSACNCSELDRGADPWEPNLSHIFHNRSEELIAYREEDPLYDALPKGDKPDRVFGLRKTQRFKQLLDHREDQRAEYRGELLANTLESQLECGPFREVQDPVLFPFLVLEAKSEEGEGFSHIETQTAFAILKLLNIQFRLKEANGKDSQWGTGPLVWFLSYRGDQWHVSAAYIQLENSVQHYRVIDLWTGQISSPEGSLQLLLIIDYIFDWGRDKYREAILRELLTLGARNVSSLADDSEVLSLSEPFQRWWNSHAEENPLEFGSYAQDLTPRSFEKFRPYESVHGVIRSANTVHTRALGLYITKDNINALLLTFDSTAKSQRVARDMLRLFKDALIVTSDALDELEHMWTGHRRETDLYGSGGDRFCAVFTATAYFSPEWEQVLELSFVAIAEDAFDELKTLADLLRGGALYFSEMPVVNQHHLTGVFRFVRQGSLRSNLQAAATRSCLSTRIAREKDHPNEYFLVAAEMFDKGIRYRMDVALLPDRDAKGREMAVWFYNRYKIGKREPQESFLRFSSMYEDRTPDSETISIWPADENHIGDQAKAILLRAKSSHNYQRPPHLCLYLLDMFADPITSLLSVVPPTSPLVVRRQDLRPGWGLYWNDEFTREADQTFKVEFQHFQAHCSAVPKFLIDGADTDAANGGEPNPQYHASKDLPAHFRKRPAGHYVTYARGADPYLGTRDLADLVVARKRNLKVITCLYADRGNSSTKGLRAEESGVRVEHLTKENISEWKERLKSDPKAKIEITNILQEGDNVVPPRTSRRYSELSSSSPEPTDMTGYAGDWLSDNELQSWLNQGILDGAEKTQPLKRARADAHSESETAPKRRRLEDETSQPAAEDATESVEILEAIPHGTLSRDYMADDELEAFLATGHFPEKKRKDWKLLNTYPEAS